MVKEIRNKFNRWALLLGGGNFILFYCGFVYIYI